MPRISLTDLVEVVSASGTRKAIKISQIKRRPKYKPAFDFYKTVRDKLAEVHKNNLPKSALDQSLIYVSDPKKLNIYPDIVRGYKKWWGRKSLVWFDPPDILFSKNGVDVSINPELGLELNGSPHLVKLYFKSDPLAKSRIEIITHLMGNSLSRMCPEHTKMSVLDIRNSKLITPNIPVPNMDAIIDAELAYISSIWNSL